MLKLSNDVFRVLVFVHEMHHQLDKETAVKMYKGMVTLQIMDTIFYEAQRQGRLSFYLTSTGEEAINMATAAALSPHDFILPQVNKLMYHGLMLI